MGKVTGLWLGWLGVIAAVVGFFFAPYWLGAIAVVLGLIVLASPQKALAWSSLVLGAIAILIPLLS
ncbi:C4-dicarboxylate ABC transporter [Cytobacillus depressus]|uniref:C4-dicarboxylate ABC transporter n=1 Tax=Cytobacillus depressus TaxID=1602942 RepID=A0A6L3VBP2_9BACI|nr:C4-dicarboxylate ABC transporter [Cytobacillus depressus]KAB2339000.1 C4-dicarboxylate ABC transporter [Cytobacillus depressus]